MVGASEVPAGSSPAGKTVDSLRCQVERDGATNPRLPPSLRRRRPSARHLRCQLSQPGPDGRLEIAMRAASDMSHRIESWKAALMERTGAESDAVLPWIRPVTICSSGSACASFPPPLRSCRGHGVSRCSKHHRRADRRRAGGRAGGTHPKMLATAARWAAKKGKPKMAPIELTAPPEQAQSITRTIFDVVREHGPLTISDVWDHIKGVGLRGLTSKRQMKIMLRWMRERQKLRLICDHDGPHKQFLYTTWFTNPKNAPLRPPNRELKGDPPKP